MPDSQDSNPQTPATHKNISSAPDKRNILIEQLEERALFDAVPIAPIDANGIDIDPSAYLETVVNAISADANQGQTQNEQQQNSEVLFVDKSVEGFESAVAEFVEGRDVDVFFINSRSAGLTQIADHLSGRTNVEAIHIISHGNDGQLNLGDSVIGQADLEGEFSSDLIRIGQALSDSGDILIYGCDLASSSHGEEFIATLGELTNADVAASDDLTGAASEGGDWQLEKTFGTVETTALSSTSFQGTLLETDAGFVVGTETLANINEIAVTPESQGGVSSRTYTNAATANNGVITIDLRITLVDTFDENGNVTTGQANQLPVTLSDFAGGPILLARNVGSSAPGFQGHTAHFRIEFYDNATNNQLSVVGDFTFRDIDFIAPGGTDSGTGSEAVSAFSDEIASYQLSSTPTTSIVTQDNADGTTTFTNFTTSGEPEDEERWVGIRFHNMPTLNLVFQARDQNTGYGLSTANFTAAPISFSQPVAEDDNFSTDQDTSISGNVVTSDNGNGADSDPDNDPLELYLVNGDPAAVGTPTTGSSGGEFTFNSDGTYTFDPNGDFDFLAPGQTAITTIEYTVRDFTGLAATATVTVVVEGLNDAPLLNGAIPNQTDFDSDAINLDTSTYFNEPDAGQALVFDTVSTLPPGLSLDANTGVISGTIDNSASQSGPYSIVLTATDPFGQAVSQTFNWTVNNPGPVATDNSNSLFEDGGVPATGNVINDDDGSGVDSDPDADGISVSAVAGGTVGGLTTGSYGAVTIDANGNYSYSIDVTNPDVEALDLNETLVDTFDYTISDGEGGTSTATLTITINGTNDAPIVGGTIPPQADFDADTVAAVDVSTYFSDPEGDTLTYSATGLPVGLTLNPTTGLITGTLDNSASQSVTGGVHSVTITAEDDNGESVSTTFAWTVSNPGPTAVDDSGSTTQAGTFAANLIGNDSDPDLDTIVVDQVNGSTSNVAATVVGTNGGVFTINPDGSYNFDTNGDFDYLAATESTTTSITYQITDNEGGTDTATLTITIDGSNDAPTNAGSIPDQADIDAQASISVPTAGFFSDVDTSDTLSYTATGLPAGLTIDSATGEITGTIDNSASQSGPYSVDVTVSDGSASTTQNFTWVVTNPGPVATNDIDSATNQTATVSGNALSNDSDPDNDDLVVTHIGNQTALTTNLGVPFGGVGGGEFTLNADGSFTFDPNGDFDHLAAGETATSWVQYRISDGEGGISEASIWVTVSGTNDTPIATGMIPDQVNVDGETVSTVDVTPYFGDFDTSDVLTYSSSNLPPGLSLDANTGLITGQLDNSASQFGPFAVTITADDGNGGSVDQVFVWEVSNPGPLAGNDSNSTDQNSSASGDVFQNDSDPDGDTITVHTVEGSLASVGSVVTGSNGGEFVINDDGSYSFNPNSDFEYLGLNQSATTQVTYTISDGEGGFDTATLEITVNGTNDAPSANGSIPNQSDLDGDAVAAVDVSTVFSDLDTGDSLTYSASGLPAGLSINSTTGLITGVLDNSASQDATGGVHSVLVTAVDSQGASTTTAFTWTVGNPGPVAINDAGSTTQSAAIVAASVIGNDSDPDGDAISVLSINGSAGLVGNSVTGSNGGQFTIYSDGSYDFAPSGAFDHLAVNESATTSVTYTITDLEGGTDSATLTITIDGLNDAPTNVGAIPDQSDLDGSSISTLDTSAYFDDVDTSDTLTFSANGLPAGLSIDPATGLITGNVDNSASLSGPYSVTVTADDGNGGTVDQVFTWNISNPGPTAGNDFNSTDQNTTTAGQVMTNDSDPDGDTISVNSVEGVAGNIGGQVAGDNGGVFVINSDGSYTFDPNGDFDSLAVAESAATAITYQITDSEGGTATAILEVTVSGTNDTPTAVGSIPDQVNLDADSITNLDTSGYFADTDSSDDFIFLASGLPAGLSIDTSTGVISGTINNSASQSGPYTVTVTASDGNGGMIDQEFTWTISNPGPSAEDNSNVVTHLSNEVATGNVVLDDDGSGLDADPDDDNLSVTQIDGTSVGLTHSGDYGDIVINSDGSYTYTLESANSDVIALTPSETLTETFQYTISDGEGGTASANLTIVVSGANFDPVVGGTIPPQVDVDSDIISAFDISTYFSDPEGETLTYSAANLPTGLSINPVTGQISGPLDSSASQDVAGGVFTVEVTATDPHGATVTSTFDWTITNPGPAAANDNFTTSEDTAVNGTVFGNDSDPDGDSVSFNQLSNGANGVASLNSDGSFTYTPDADFHGTDSFTYEIVDADGDTASATVTITVDPVNDPPVVGIAIPDQANLDSDIVSLDVSSNFTDVEGDGLTFTATGLPNGLSIDTAGNITGTIDSSASQDGPFTVVVTADDGNGGTISDTFTWSVTNPAPTAVNDDFTTNEDTPVSGTVVGNDGDADSDALTFNKVTDPNNGSVVFNSDGTFTYTPDADYNGIDTFTYRVVDADGLTSMATVTIDVDSINDPPVVVANIPDQISLDSDIINVDVSPNFSDVESGVLTFSATGLPAGLSIDSNGNITGSIDTSASQNGPYTVVITAEDADGGTVTDTFTWNISNPGPIATNDGYSTNEDIAVSGSVGVNDSDPDGDATTFTQLTNPSNGSVVFSNDGTFTYTPDPGYFGTDSFEYEIVDADGDTSSATVTINIGSINDLPVVDANIPDQTNFDSDNISLSVGSNFSDPDNDPLTFSASGLPTGLSIDASGNITGTIDSSASQSGPFTVVITAEDGNGGSVTDTFTWTISNPGPVAANDNFTTPEDTTLSGTVFGNDSDPDGDAVSFNQLSNGANGVASLNSDGSFTYTPDADFHGTDSFTYEIVDADGDTASATVTITVDPVNDPPVIGIAIPDQANLDSDIVSLDVSGNFTDVEGDGLSFSATGLPTGLSIDAAGNITGTIDSSASQDGPFTVVVTADDGNGGTVSDTFTWSVTNPAPTAVNDDFTTNEDTPVSGTVVGNDGDADSDLLTFNQLTNPSDGTVVFNNDGTFTYTPDADFNGIDSFTYEVVDADGLTSMATVTIDVDSINDPPVVVANIPDQISLDSDAIQVNISPNFSDVDGNPLTFSATGLPTGISIDPAGNITGTIDPSASQNGPYAVVITADDGNGGIATDTFTWSVSNPGPVAINDSYTTNEDASVSGLVGTNDSDPDGDSTSFTQLTNPSDGSVVFNNDGTFTYTPDADFFGTDSFDYQIVDADGDTSNATVTITIDSVNDGPVVDTPIPDQVNLDSDLVNLDVAENFSDIENDNLTFTATGLPSGLSIDPSGNITGTIDSSASQSGPFTVVVTAQDSSGALVTDTFSWSVSNPVPVATNDNFTTSEDTTINATVVVNDSDSDGDAVTYNQLSVPSNGLATLNSDGSFSYTPNPDFYGTDSFTYEIVDADGDTSTATVTVTVDPVNDPPVVSVAIPDQANLDSDNVSLDISNNFTDVEGDGLTFSVTGLPTGLSVDAAGNITGTIDSSASQDGPFTVVVTADDGNGGAVSDTFTWSVTNPAPTAVNDNFVTNEDTAVSGTVVGNDSDVDTDALTFNQLTNPSYGTVVFNNDGTFTYTPNAEFNGTDSFDYEVVDADGLTSTATVIIDVDPANDPPVVNANIPDQTSLDSDVIQVNISPNFSDVDGNPLTFSATGLPSGLSIDSAGNITGTIDSSASQNGPYTIVITADDGSGGTVTDTFTWNISNPAPIATNDSYTTNEDTSVSGLAGANDSDPDGDSTTYNQLSNTANGTVVFNSDGTFTYTPNSDFFGSDSFNYQIVDADGDASNATVTITVNSVNDLPTGMVPDQTNIDSELIGVDLSPYFSDVESSSLSFTSSGLPNGLTIDSAGLVTGTIDSSASQSGPFAVSVTATDGDGGTTTEFFTWNVSNPGPNAVNDSVSTLEDTPVSGDASTNDSDPDSDGLTFNQLTNPSDGTVVFNNDGTFDYTPNAQFSGVDSFDYEIVDVDGSTSTATVTIVVGDVNDPPTVATPIPDQSSQDSEVVAIDIGPNFSDLEGDVLSFSATGLPPGIAIDSSGNITGTIDNSASQAGPYTVVVIADDGNGGTVTDTFTWSVSNPGPTATDNMNLISEDASTVNGNVILDNNGNGVDSDPDMDLLNVSAVDGQAAGVGVAVNGNYGSVQINGDGSYTYSLNTIAPTVQTLDVGDTLTETFEYAISDGEGGTDLAQLTITIEGSNDAPVGSSIPNQSNVDNSSPTLNVSPLFTDVEFDTLSFTASGLPAGLSIDPVTGVITGTIDGSASVNGPSDNGIYPVSVTATDDNGDTATIAFDWTVSNPIPIPLDDDFATNEDTQITDSVVGNDSDPDNDELIYSLATDPLNGDLVFNPDGSFTYTPDPNFHGNDTFDYLVTDEDGDQSSATVTIEVYSVNDLPVLSNIPDQDNLDGDLVTLNLNPIVSDVDGDSPAFSIAGLPPGLTMTNGVVSGAIDSSASQSGPYTVTVTIDDGNGGLATESFVWNVANPGPVAVNDVFTTPEDTLLTNTVATNDGDPDGDALTFSLINQPSNGTVTLNSDGTFEYLPNPGFNGFDLFDYAIEDADGEIEIATVTIGIGAVNDPPILVTPIADQVNLDSDVVNVHVSSNFADPDTADTLTYSADGLPPGLSIDSLTGIVFGTLDPSASQGGPYNVEVTATDPLGLTVTDTFVWEVANPSPVAQDDFVNTTEDSPVTSTAATNDSDPDGDSLTFNLLTLPSNGSVVMQPDGTFTYTPTQDFVGTDSFDYVITDTDGSVESATVTVNVTPVNDAPAAVNDSVSTNEDTPVTVVPTTNDSDVDSTTLSISQIVTPPTNGEVVVNPNGSVTYTPNPNFFGTDTFVYEVCDDFGGCDTATVTVTVAPINDAPVANDDNGFTVLEDTPLMGSVVGNDIDVENETLTYSLTSLPNDGILAFNPDGTFTFLPDANFTGTVTFDYEIADMSGGTDSASVTIEVTGVNDAPLAADDSAAVQESTTVVVPLLANDVDPEADDINVTEINGITVQSGDRVTLPSGATVTLNSDGSVNYNTNGQFEDLLNGQSAFDTFFYTISDSEGQTSVAESVIMINGENDVPVAQDDFISTSVDTPVILNVTGNDSDVEGEQLAVVLLNQPNDGTAVVNPDGTILFTPDTGFEGTSTLHYLIEDESGGSTDATVTIDVAPQFQFDSFTNFSESSHARGIDQIQANSRRVLSQEIFTLAPEPIFSGYASPGTQIVGRIYDASGALIGEASANVDAGGNWMMQFQGTKGHNFYRIEFETVSVGAADVYGYLGLGPGDNSYQSMSPMTAYDKPLSIESAMQTSEDALEDASRHNNRSLGFDR